MRSSTADSLPHPIKVNRAPSFQFYPADWRKDPGVQALDYFDRGVWFEILCIMFESDERGRLVLNGQRMPDEALARLLGLDNQILTTTLTTLLQYGVARKEPDTGIIFNKRMVEDEALRQIRRECGSRGGNPSLLGKKSTSILDNQNPTTGVNQNSTPSSSSSSSKKKRILSDSQSSDPSSSAKKPIDPKVKVVIDYFSQTVEAEKGFKPEISKADGARVKTLLNSRAEETLKNIIGFFLDSEKADKVGITLSIALSNHTINTYLQRWEKRKWQYGDDDTPPVDTAWWRE